jgi:hypothetical protein
MSIAAHTITDLLSVKEARSSSTARAEPYDIHAMGRDPGRLRDGCSLVEQAEALAEPLPTGVLYAVLFSLCRS